MWRSVVHKICNSGCWSSFPLFIFHVKHDFNTVRGMHLIFGRQIGINMKKCCA